MYTNRILHLYIMLVVLHSPLQCSKVFVQRNTRNAVGSGSMLYSLYVVTYSTLYCTALYCSSFVRWIFSTVAGGVVVRVDYNL